MKAELNNRGFEGHNIWRHSVIVRELYRKRARCEAEEMTCAAQAAELLTPFFRPGDSVLDAGCGSGYFFHSLAARGLDAEYHGFDATAELIEVGQNELPAFGLPVDRLRVCRLEDFQGAADHVPVSYTHLDVYKRQPSRWSSICSSRVVSWRASSR